ncbi:wiskott-Aldrich syndrome protein homolog [Bos indicus x Bos taurus]|uniref:wiskott-Aldrich syndrome protein homolog n=1 Tax=Bos indicus x Bos taurus TaxID=30522 RepID=UPI000F7D0D25|nr:wiskott-Aldrich syndrome protein homolog [Bos indicus x Bos taurus]
MFMGHFGAAGGTPRRRGEPEPRLHHSSDGGGGGGGGGGNNNSQASGSSRPPARLLRRGSLRRRKESAALRGPRIGRPAARAPTTHRHRGKKKGVPPTPRPRPPAAPAPPATRRGETPSPRLPGPKDLGRPMKRRFELALKNEQGYSRSKRCRKHVPGRSICMRGWWNRTGETRSVSLPLSWKPRGPSVDMRNHKIMAA